LFSLTKTEYALPEYRFQAVQDGDRATLAGEYNQALNLYQQAITDIKLEWWSQNRRNFEIQISENPNSTISPPPSPDPAEYPNLVAYAYYRVLILNAMRGLLPEAQATYSTLEKQFPQGQVGHAYAEMASAFWSEYQMSHNSEKACEKAIEYASLNSTDILAYLGNGAFSKTFYGDQSLEYEPENVCPFR